MEELTADAVVLDLPDARYARPLVVVAWRIDEEALLLQSLGHGSRGDISTAELEHLVAWDEVHAFVVRAITVG